MWRTLDDLRSMVGHVHHLIMHWQFHYTAIGLSVVPLGPIVRRKIEIEPSWIKFFERKRHVSKIKICNPITIAAYVFYFANVFKVLTYNRFDIILHIFRLRPWLEFLFFLQFGVHNYAIVRPLAGDEEWSGLRTYENVSITRYMAAARFPKGNE